MSFIAVVLVLGGLIFFHELGHFLVARLLGMGVKAFSLGFGPKLFSFTHGMTEYRLCAIPLGGYVLLAGESPDNEDDAAAIPEKLLFSARPVWQRMAVVAAGPVFNFLLAWGIYWALFATQGQMGLAPNIGEVLPESPAARAGFQSGDRIESVDGRGIIFWEDLTERIQDSGGRVLKMDVKRGKESLVLEVAPEMRVRKNIFGEEKATPMLGIVASKEVIGVELTAGESFRISAKETWRAIETMVMALVKMIERVIPADSIGGPILIAQLISKEAQSGWVELFALAAALSANLGFVNLLPIPVLDGGHLVFFSLEAVMRRPLGPRVRAMAMRVGIAMLAALMLLATYNDLRRLFQ